MAEQMADEKLTRKEFLALPMDERRKLLEKQANDPEVIAYYEGLNEADKAHPDREKIARKVCIVCDQYNSGSQNCNLTDNTLCRLVLEVADQILSLIDPEGRQVAEEIFRELGQVYLNSKGIGEFLPNMEKFYYSLKLRYGGGE